MKQVFIALSILALVGCQKNSGSDTASTGSGSGSAPAPEALKALKLSCSAKAPSNGWFFEGDPNSTTALALAGSQGVPPIDPEVLSVKLYAFREGQDKSKDGVLFANFPSEYLVSSSGTTLSCEEWAKAFNKSTAESNMDLNDLYLGPNVTENLISFQIGGDFPSLKVSSEDYKCVTSKTASDCPKFANTAGPNMGSEILWATNTYQQWMPKIEATTSTTAGWSNAKVGKMAAELLGPAPASQEPPVRNKVYVYCAMVPLKFCLDKKGGGYGCVNDKKDGLANCSVEDRGLGSQGKLDLGKLKACIEKAQKDQKSLATKSAHCADEADEAN